MTATAWLLLGIAGLLPHTETGQDRTGPCLRACPGTAKAESVGQVLLYLTCLAIADDADDSSVEAGQRALDHRFRYPWYDRRQDDLRPIDVSPPWYDRWHLPEIKLGSGEGKASTAESVSGVSLFVWIVLAALVILILAAAIWSFLRRDKARDRLDDKVRDAVGQARWKEALPLDTTIPQSAYLDVARRHYEAGRYREAIVYLFSYQLVELDKHQFVRLARGKTNRQYLRELGARRPLRRLVEQTMVAFEDAFFGHRAIGKGRFEACWSRLAEFQALTAEGTA